MDKSTSLLPIIFGCLTCFIEDGIQNTSSFLMSQQEIWDIILEELKDGMAKGVIGGLTGYTVGLLIKNLQKVKLNLQRRYKVWKGRK